VTPELVRTYASLGHPLDKDAIVSMRIHGVTPQYIRDMAALGYGRLTADQLVSMRIHGVTADYVRALHSQGLRPSSADQIVRLRISGYRPGQR
jgi:hypothetical protein